MDAAESSRDIWTPCGLRCSRQICHVDSGDLVFHLLRARLPRLASENFLVFLKEDDEDFFLHIQSAESQLSQDGDVKTGSHAARGEWTCSLAVLARQHEPRSVRITAGDNYCP